MKPRILILMHYMELGGAEISLIGLLNALDPERVDVDLFIHSHQGPLMKFIPKWVNILPEVKAYSMIERPMKDALRAGEWRLVANRIRGKMLHRKYLQKEGTISNDISVFQYIADCVTPSLPLVNPGVEYDLCISFLIPHNIGRDKVRAHKRIAWIHTDYSTVHVNAEKELPVWDTYDHIASISPDVTASFLKTFPSLSSKIIEIENILSPTFVRSRAEEFDASDEMGRDIRLLSVGRFTHAKNYDNVPFIASRIVKNGIRNFKWYIIGYGDDSLIKANIAATGMEKHVVILGKKENPYPYIKACDIYVQPSRYEGKSVTVREAQMLCKPVIITNYTTANSQINSGIDGIIVPMENNGCGDAITELIRDNATQLKLRKYLTSHDFGNENEVYKIYNLIPKVTSL